MSDCEDGDVDVESSEDVPDIGEEATATTTNGIMYRVSGRGRGVVILSRRGV